MEINRQINIDQLGAVELPPPEPLKSIQKKPEAWDITQFFYSLKKKAHWDTGNTDHGNEHRDARSRIAGLFHTSSCDVRVLIDGFGYPVMK